ncbi:MAG: acetate kinase [Clostridia bacterium]|nr:acetate kinase [Clostridia bacterium]
MKILVLNCGSSSLKFQVIDMEKEDRIVKGNYERIGGKRSCLRLNVRGEKSEIEKAARNYEEAIKTVLSLIKSEKYNIISSLDEIGAVGHRIVHGGEKYSQSVLITDEVVKEIEKCIPLAPLHNPEGIEGIKATRKALKDVPMVAVFDTAFHQTMPKKAYIYQIPYRYYEQYQIRKYGFHGTSHRYVAGRVAELLGKDVKDLKIINCHLGQGASLCAIDGGKSIDTTMGLTPTAGIPMATRCGDIDPAIIPYIMRIEDLDAHEIERMINKKSGAWGVSGVSEDYRDIEREYLAGDDRSILALDTQAYKIAQTIASYMVSLGGLDVITFSGGVGEKGYEARLRICKQLEFLGIKIDEERNDMRGEERLISTDDSKIKLYVVPTNEELMIARDTYAIVKNK